MDARIQQLLASGHYTPKIARHVAELEAKVMFEKARAKIAEIKIAHAEARADAAEINVTKGEIETAVIKEQALAAV